MIAWKNYGYIFQHAPFLASLLILKSFSISCDEFEKFLTFTARQTILPSCRISINLTISSPSSFDAYVSNALAAMRAPVFWFKTNAAIPRIRSRFISDTLQTRRVCQSKCQETKTATSFKQLYILKNHCCSMVKTCHQETKAQPV